MARPLTDLPDFLDRIAGRTFTYGTADCLITIADWVVLNGHPDPASPWRNQYPDRIARRRLLRDLGGLKGAMAQGAALAGLPPTTTPVERDVGLIHAEGRTFAALCLGDLWAAQGRGLIVLEPSRILSAWRV